MKTKEQLAEEHGKKWNKDEYNILAYDSFLAGYDAAKSEDAKIIAAKDEKIRELEESGGRKNLVDKTNKLEIATSCINEMQNLLKPYMNPNNSLGETITKAFNLGALFNSNNHDLFNQYLATTEKIKELEKANADCISLYLHEQRMKDANELIDELNKCLNIELIEEIAIRGVCYGGDGFGFSLAQKQMNDVYKMMLDLSLITEKIKAYNEGGK